MELNDLMQRLGPHYQVDQLLNTYRFYYRNSQNRPRQLIAIMTPRRLELFPSILPERPFHQLMEFARTHLIDSTREAKK